MSFDFVSRCQIYINYIHIHVNIYVQKSAFERNGKSFRININYSATNKIHPRYNSQSFTYCPKFRISFLS